MGARTKLNAAYFLGAGLLAAFVGIVFQSWLAFLIVFSVLVAINCYEGSIRMTPIKR